MPQDFTKDFFKVFKIILVVAKLKLICTDAEMKSARWSFGLIPCSRQNSY